MRAHLAFAFLAATSLAVSCNTDKTDGAPPPEKLPANTVRVTMPQFSVPTGESFNCYYAKTVTDKELSVITATGTAEVRLQNSSCKAID